jgi:hypothetical protein
VLNVRNRTEAAILARNLLRTIEMGPPRSGSLTRKEN